MEPSKEQFYLRRIAELLLKSIFEAKINGLFRQKSP
jgi:hypothetical protein